MEGRHVLSRRELLIGSVAVGVTSLARAAGLPQSQGAASAVATAQRVVHVVSGQNTALVVQELTRTLGFMKEFGLEPTYVNVADGSTIAGRLASGQSDIWAMSGFGQLLPVIEKGEKLKILAGAEIHPIRAVEDLVGRDTLVRVLAAYAKVYRFIQGPRSREVFIEARTAALGGGEHAGREGPAQWNFFQKNKPFAEDLVLSESRIRYLQELNIALGLQKALLPYEQVTDMSLARDAIRLLV